jgi:hemerythrin-like domain-containing protein
MKRIEQLRSLSMEHHLSLVLANKAINTAKKGDESAIKALCQQIAEEFNSRWDLHFAKEEQTIFAIFMTNYHIRLIAEGHEDARLVEQLTEQHNQLRTLSNAMREGDTKALAHFGQLLRDHTRLEERRLFPLISELFTPQELNKVAKATPRK